MTHSDEKTRSEQKRN